MMQCSTGCLVARQRGVVLLIMLLVVFTASASMLLGRLNANALRNTGEQRDALELAKASAALVGYAVRSTGRPGGLPCPDVDDDGFADATPPVCNGLTGRLPWRTLGLADIRDSAGERLWYTVSGSHQEHSGGVINSDTPALLTLDTVTDVAAIVLAPGEVTGSQNRSGANRLLAVNYLEDDNADGDPGFVSRSTAGVNDHLTILSRRQLMRAVEQRVLGEVRNRLRDYFDQYAYLPYAAMPGDSSCCGNGVREGLVPVGIGAACVPAAGGACSGSDWPAAWPAWFLTDRWADHVVYAVAAPCAVPLLPGCAGSGALLAVNGPVAPVTGQMALLMTAGSSLPGQDRATQPVMLSDYLEGAENTDGNAAYNRPDTNGVSNDQLRMLAP